MRQSTLYLDYPYYQVSLDDLTNFKFIKENGELKAYVTFFTQDKRTTTNLSIGDSVEILTKETVMKLTFKKPYEFNQFLDKNESALNQFRVIKFNFKDIKGVSTNEPH